MDSVSSSSSSSVVADSDTTQSPSPGKVSRTSSLGVAAGSSTSRAPAAGDATSDAPVQRKHAEPFDFLDSGAEARPLEPGIRRKAEQSLGGDLGDVRVHQGEQAAQANRELGSRAFAHGADVVLGGGVDNSANPVMAHELAHVAQQRGAAPGVAAKSERGASSSAHEVEADQAAAAILVGAPATISQLGAERVMCFEGAEHMDIGNAAYGGQKVTVGKVTLPAGAFTALQGDFFGDFKEMEQACHSNPKLIYDYYDVLVKEGKLRDLHQKDPDNHAEPDSNGPIMVASALNGRNPNEYLDLAATNFNHFSEQNVESAGLFIQAAVLNPAYAPEIAGAAGKFGHNIAQWLKMHLEAGRTAFQDGTAGKELGGVGVAMDAAALHYLTDAFAAGHMRVPRMEMYDSYISTFKANARKYVDGFVDQIPSEIDVKQFISDAASGAVGAVRDQLPGAVNTGLDLLGSAASAGADLLGAGADAAGIALPSMPSIPPIKINLAGVKAAIKAKLHPICDDLGKFAGEKIAGFSAKVLHDHDNAAGVDVTNDAGDSWKAMGDHALTKSPENDKIAKQCSAASATHIKDLHAAGKSHSKDAKKDALVMPFVSLKPILSKLPQVSAETMAEKTGPGEERDWHWDTMSADYRGKILKNATSSIEDTVASAFAGIKDKLVEAVTSKVNELLSGLGQYAGMLASKAGLIVEKILSYLPTIDPALLVAAMLRAGK